MADDGTHAVVPLKPTRTRQLKHWHLEAIRLAVKGNKATAIAPLVGRSRTIVARFLNRPDILLEIRKFHDAAVESVLGCTPVEAFESALPKAIQKLIAKLDCGDDKVEFLAACRLLDNAGYVPVKRIAIAEDEQLSKLNPEQLRHYVATGQLPASLAVVDVG